MVSRGPFPTRARHHEHREILDGIFNSSQGGRYLPSSTKYGECRKTLAFSSHVFRLGQLRANKHSPLDITALGEPGRSTAQSCKVRQAINGLMGHVP